MRILIVSRTPWDTANSFGNTFSNLFGKMTDVEIYHICCKHGETNGSPAVKTFQMTDRSVMHSILHRKGGVGWLADNSTDRKANAAVSYAAEKKKRPLAYYVRDLIWSLGAWKKDAALCAFLQTAKPDVLYLPLYASCYMCDVQQYIADMLQVPTVGHISDNVFACSPDASLSVKCYARRVAGKLRQLIRRCAYLEVFAENMQKQYAEFFEKPIYLIGKGVDIDALPAPPAPTGHPEKHFVYTGNIGNGRFSTLLSVGEALCTPDGKAAGVLDIYSATPLTEEMAACIKACAGVCFHGAVPADKISEIQKNADVLVHVEGFSPSAVAAAEMSFSTKLIDYMLAGRPILAIGDAAVNSIQVLQKHGVGIVAASPADVGAAVRSLLNDEVDLAALRRNTIRYLKDYRNQKQITDGIRARLYEAANAN